MRIVFAGTPEFAAVALGSLLAAAPARGWLIPLVLTQPDRPAGRGLKLAPGPVKQLALAHEIEVASPTTLRQGDEAGSAQAQIAAAEPDVLIVAAYGLILPQKVLDIPRRHGAINIHASLLPRWRGAAPIARAIEAGDRETGITIMQMDAGLDTGPMLMARAVPIAADASSASLTPELAALGGQMIVEALIVIESLVPIAQPQVGATYARKIQKAEAWLDWRRPADRLARQVRAFNPFPVAAARLEGETIRIWHAIAIDSSTEHEAGTVVAAGFDGIRIACGVGELLVTELQRPGGRQLTAREFVAGSAPRIGARFELAPMND